ncbi:MAG: doxx family protein [Flavobacteriaceae bacterium]|nr:doxx family protein [Flavobacteriaceae bacterium]
MKSLLSNLLRHIKAIDFMLFSIGVVYLWFGLLKFFPALSPAEELAKNTINQLTFGYIPIDISYFMLAVWETAVGALLLFGLYKRTAIILALVHMFFTFMPLVLFPDVSFADSPFSFTIVGQYIIKNIIIVSALFLLLKRYGKRGYRASKA